MFSLNIQNIHQTTNHTTSRTHKYCWVHSLLMELLCLQGEVAVTIIGGSIHKPPPKNNKMLQDVNLHPTAYVQSFILPQK